MGHKVHPYGFRIGIIRGWKAKWFNEKHYLETLHDDLMLRKEIKRRLREGAVARVELDRQGNDIVVTIFTARPGIVIGTGRPTCRGIAVAAGKTLRQESQIIH